MSTTVHVAAPASALSPLAETDPHGLTPDQVRARSAVERRLWYWNLACGILHLVQAVAALGAALSVPRIRDFKLPLTTLFLDWNGPFPVQNLVVRATLPFAATTSGFAFMSAAAHFTVLAFFNKYLADLRKGLNQFRWYEYAASSSLMIALIAMLFGVYDILSLVLIMSINCCMNLFGMMMEVHNQTTTKVDWRSFWYGCFAGIVPWAIIFASLGGLGSRASEVPSFVWVILVIYFVMFNTFPINMILQYLQVGAWGPRQWGGKGNSGYYFGEVLYQVQSIVSKSLLLWLVIGGTNQPNQYSQ